MTEHIVTTEALEEQTRPDYHPGDPMRYKGSDLVGTFIRWDDTRPGYVVILCPGNYRRIEPHDLWQPESF